MGIQNVLGVNYPYPDEGDKPWGVDHIDWATAVSDATNSLQAEVDNINNVEIPALQAQINLSGEANTSSNEGAGEGLALPKVGVNLPFKSLVAGTGVGITSGADTLTINATSSGDVTGPIASIDGNVAIYNGTTGKIIKMAGVNIDASDNVSQVNDLTTINDVNVGNNLAITGDITAVTGLTSTTPNQFWENYTRSNGTSVGVRGVAISAECGSITETTTTPQDIGVTATLTTTGRPVLVFLTNDSSSGIIQVFADASGNIFHGRVSLLRDGTIFASSEIAITLPTTALGGIQVPPGSVMGISLAAAGTYDFTATIASLNSDSTINIDDVKIVAFEL